MDDGVLKDQALTMWMHGQKHHLRGDLERAIELYTKSLGLYPTAEAYTFRGWAYSFQGRVDEAIEECKKAIAVDPTFGNPYNDIGSLSLSQIKSEHIDGAARRGLVVRRRVRPLGRPVRSARPCITTDECATPL